jgi:uncharacterized damage-inducible protein DinB
MIDARGIRDLYRYNRWANHRLIEAAGRLTTDEFTRDLGSSHGSVRDTLVHACGAEWVWLQRWKGVSPRSVFPPGDFPVLETLKARWSECETEQQAFLETRTTNKSVLAVVPYVNLRGEAWHYPLWQQMVHVVNHSTYHRGQVTTMLRQLSKQIPATDLLVFYDELDDAV